jgi:ribokinase
MVGNDMRSGARVAIRDIHAGVSAPITVAGSLNMDFVVQVQKLPQPGETVMGGGFVTIPGGKGANQACAAGRLGGRVRMLGRVGDDVFGRQLRESLAGAGVDTKAVRVSGAVASGVALIFVEAGGQNEIVVASGANGLLTPDDVAQDLGDASGFLLLQLETPLATIERAAAIASERGMTVILDPAPAQPLPEALLARVSVLTPNESEALVLLDRRGTSVSLAEAPEVARALLKRGTRSVILKLGEQGAFFQDASGGRHFPGFAVKAVDATAAGDTFGGALGVALAEGRSMDDAIRFANAAAALSVTRLGAQASMPERREVEALLAGRFAR